MREPGAIDKDNLWLARFPMTKAASRAMDVISEVTSEKLDIDLRLGVQANAERIFAESPDAVVIATGSIPKENPFPGEYEAPDVVNTVQVLNGEVEPGQKVLFIDLDGHHHG